jgi:formate dehydrogenase beta subunit
VVDEVKCVGCGACEKACPKGILDRAHHVQSACCTSTRKKTPWPPAADLPGRDRHSRYIRLIKEGDYEGR